MKYYMPTEVYCERNAVLSHTGEWTVLGSKALIVTGKSSARNGSLADAKEALESENIPYVIFDETEENPSVEMVMKVRDLGISENVDFVIGIGGGSPMDAAKAIALMIYHKDKTADYLYQKGDDTTLPVVAIPTTCGTGSEVTAVSVLTNHAQNKKASIPHPIFPKYALVDGKYLIGTPKQILVNTSVDALAHLLESYINVKSNPLSQMLCEYGLGLWSKSKECLVSGEYTEEDYDRMILTATIAGMAIAQNGTTVPHGLSYYLTYALQVPHGKAAGYFQAGYLEAAKKETKEKALALIGCEDIDEFNNLIHRLIGPLEIADIHKEKAIQSLMANEAKLKVVPYEVTEELLSHFFELAH